MSPVANWCPTAWPHSKLFTIILWSLTLRGTRTQGLPTGVPVTFFLWGYVKYCVHNSTGAATEDLERTSEAAAAAKINTE